MTGRDRDRRFYFGMTRFTGRPCPYSESRSAYVIRHLRRPTIKVTSSRRYDRTDVQTIYAHRPIFTPDVFRRSFNEHPRGLFFMSRNITGRSLVGGVPQNQFRSNWLPDFSRIIGIRLVGPTT